MLNVIRGFTRPARARQAEPHARPRPCQHHTASRNFRGPSEAPDPVQINSNHSLCKLGPGLYARKRVARLLRRSQGEGLVDWPEQKGPTDEAVANPIARRHGRDKLGRAGKSGAKMMPVRLSLPARMVGSWLSGCHALGCAGWMSAEADPASDRTPKYSTLQTRPNEPNPLHNTTHHSNNSTNESNTFKQPPRTCP